ncbi:MAG: magnesium transporter [Motiliproteus sp.]|nr:magnesium transporter [Motiliproteus sp.]
MPKSAKLYQQAGMIIQALDVDAEADIGHLIGGLNPAEIARLLESLPSETRRLVWPRVSIGHMAEVLLRVHKDLRRELARHTEEAVLVESLGHIQADELADLDDDLPIEVLNAMVTAMDEQRRQRYEMVKNYPDDSAGGLMDVDATAVRADVTLKSVQRYLRILRAREGELAEHLDSLMVVDRHNRLCGVLPLSILVATDQNAVVDTVMLRTPSSFIPLQADAEVARVFADRDLISAPVVNDDGRLLGRITVDDVVDVMRNQADKELLGRAGLDKGESIFSPLWLSSLRRALWLGINLLTAFMAAWVIGLFEASIEKLVALAVLMPVVASMAGIAGSQTLTVVTRGIALEQIGQENFIKLLRHEMGIGLINGAFWSSLVSLVAYLWFGDWLLGLVFGASLLIGILTGAIAGAVIPIALKRVGVDPALAGGVILTTATDMIGFFFFLGTATLVLL